MRSLAVVGAVLTVGAAPAAARVAAPPIPIPPPIAISPPLTLGQAGSVSLSTNRAGARPVGVALRFASELRCGSVRAGRLLVRFPAAEHVPSQIATTSVLVNGRSARAVTPTGTTLAVAVPQLSGISCGVITPGIVRVVFKPAAGLGNPASAGTYPISVRGGTRLMMRAAFRIQP